MYFQLNGDLFELHNSVPFEQMSHRKKFKDKKSQEIKLDIVYTVEIWKTQL